MPYLISALVLVGLLVVVDLVLTLGMAIAAARWAAGRWSAVTGEYRRNA